ncbi:DNA cytosine methyltransferase [Rhizobium leguminosarum]
MKGHSPTEIPPGAGASAREALLRLRRKQSKGFVEIADAVESLRKVSEGVSDLYLAHWLCEEVGFSFDEACFYLMFQERLGDRTHEIIKHRLSGDVLYSLLLCDDLTRAEVLVILESGEAVDARFVETIRDRNRRKALSEATLATTARRLGIQSAADRFKDNLEQHARELLKLMEDFCDQHIYYYVWETPDEPDELFDVDYIETEEFFKDRAAMASKATALRQDLELLFGAEHAPREEILDIAVENDFTASVALSWHALKDIEAESFTPFEIEHNGHSFERLRSCVEFLAGRKNRSTPLGTNRRTPSLPSIPDESLKMIDIAAGSGGASLGLETAGFLPVIQYEARAHARALLTENNTWRVTDQVGHKSVPTEFAKYKDLGISLVTSGTSLKHFSLTPRNSDDIEYDNFGHALAAVRSIKPAAFFFEVDPTIASPANRPFKAEIDDLFAAEGYETRWHSVDVSRIGIPQKRPRLVLIGMRNGTMASFRLSPMIEPVLVDVVEAIGDLVLEAHAGDAALQDWATAWTQNNAGELVPVIAGWQKSSSADSDDWNDLRIDPKYASAPPVPARFSPGTYRMRLTADMLKRLQGFPGEWIVVHQATGTWDFRLLEVTVPPRLAKYVGLAIYSAITGQQFDLKEAMTRSLYLPPEPRMKKIVIRHGRTPYTKQGVANPSWTVEVPVDWAPPKGLRRRASDQSAALREVWRNTFAAEPDPRDEELYALFPVEAT